MTANAGTIAPSGQKKLARGKERSNAAPGHASQNTSSPERAKEGGWPVVPLGEIAEVKLGKMLDKTKHKTGQRLPYLRNVNVRWGTIETEDLFEMNFEEDQLDRFGLKANDVLVCEGGEPGRASVWNGHLPELKFQKALHRVRFKVPFDPRLLVYLLELLAKSGGLERRFTGSTIKHFTREAFVRLPIPFPPEKEQRRIVAEIEKQFTRLEAGVAALRRVQANLKRYRAAVLKAACEGRLVATEAELAKAENRKFETGEELLARILTERRQNWQGRGKYKEPDAPDTGNLSPLPAGWTWGSVEQLTSLVTSGSRGWGEFYSNAGPLFIRAQDIKTDSLKLGGIARVALPARAEGMRSSVENSDVLITITGANVTKSAIVRSLAEVAFVSQHVALLKPVCREGAVFSFLWIISPAHGRKLLEKWAYGAGKPGLSLEQIRTLPIALPPVAEQTRIVAEVERRLSVLEALEAVVAGNLHRATRVRQSILERAFNNQL